MTKSRDLDFFVCRDQLCDACVRVNYWLTGGGDEWLTSRSEARSNKAKKKEEEDKVLAARVVAAASPPRRRRHRYSPTQSSRTTRWEGHGPDESMYHPGPTTAKQDGGARCPLSEAFERAVRIEGGVGASAPADWFPEEEEEEWWSRGGVREDEGGYASSIGHSWDLQQEGEYGPLRPPRPPSYVGNNRHGGLSSWLGGFGGCSRRSGRRMAGNKKRVRFARKAEVLPFRGDCATTTLGSLGREYKSCR